MNQIVKGEIIICLHCKQIIKITNQIKSFNNSRITGLQFLCPLCKGKLKLFAEYRTLMRIEKYES